MTNFKHKIAVNADGALYVPDFLDKSEQILAYSCVQKIFEQAPLFSPTMPKTNQPMSVQMSNCGRLGWVSDVQGYRYQANHPITQKPWPEMPPFFIQIWQELTSRADVPDACLINLYSENAKMGLHQDKDERDFSAPVVSISLGASALFRIGGLSRKGATQSLKLHSGDAFMLAGKSRLAFHGIDRIYKGTSSLIAGDARLNLTMRKY